MNVYFNAAILILQLVLLLSFVSSVPRRLQKKNKGGNTRIIGKRQLIAMEALQSAPGVFHKKLKTHVQPLEESCQSASFKNEFNSIRQQVKCEPRDTVVDLVPPLGATLRLLYQPNPLYKYKIPCPNPDLNEGSSKSCFKDYPNQMRILARLE